MSREQRRAQARTLTARVEQLEAALAKRDRRDAVMEQALDDLYLLVQGAQRTATGELPPQPRQRGLRVVPDRRLCGLLTLAVLP